MFNLTERVIRRLDSAEGLMPIASGYKVLNFTWHDEKGQNYGESAEDVLGGVYTLRDGIDLERDGITWVKDFNECFIFFGSLARNLRFASVTVFEDWMYRNDVQPDRCRTLRIDRLLSRKEVIELLRATPQEHRRAEKSETSLFVFGGNDCTGCVGIYGGRELDGSTRIQGGSDIIGCSDIHGGKNVRGSCNAEGIKDVCGGKEIYGADGVDRALRVRGAHNSGELCEVHGADQTHGVSDGYGLYEVCGGFRVYGANHVKYCAEVFGAWKCLFTWRRQGVALNIFNTQVTNERFDEVWFNMDMHAHGWAPRFTTAEELREKSGGEWANVPADFISGRLRAEAFYDMPAELYAYIHELPEYNGMIFNEITGHAFAKRS